MNVGFNTSQFDLEKIRRLIEKKSSEVVEHVALKTYNAILLNEFPYYSGSYISSWNINVGAPDTSFNAPSAWGTRGPNVQYAIPEVKYDIDQVNPYQSVFISNYAPHAYQVEFNGTPKHPDPWMIAHHAVSSASTSFRFF